MSETVKQNSLRAWWLASRPKTLTAAAVPVMIGSATTWHETQGVGMEYVAMTLCFLFAFVMQIDANFVNDYYDCVRGCDNEQRLGPQRACQQGWVTLRAMRLAIAITSVLACIVGLPLVLYGGWQLIWVGIACLVFCFLYTTMLAGKGLGDLLVLLFFGLVPCYFTYYVTMPAELHTFTNANVWLLSLATGCVVDTLLLVNNYRDINNDSSVGKRTLVVLLGKMPTEWLYFLIVPVAITLVIVSLSSSWWQVLYAIAVLIPHLHTWYTMRKIGEGTALNRVLGMTARNIFIFGILTTVLIILS